MTPQELFVVGKSRHPLLCRWWLRTRKIKPEPRGGMPVFEFYTPWWAWPLELLHRLVFGRARLEPIEEG